ncbi:hypothetical protein F4813DRAFT_136605 [Daldinia decipiens]|uniref:uncharacterized protein n=1 Tax=Daldinia decipiens TaxID=326647 RepID=UPI0020C3A606|nr:uncharacterized protein F4813DRAFT_136605 [Daldinia decipiens]KAI1656177.1 hypothetical protein F4813DRAFT_136605 [Daldinia decipiens]
MAPAKEDEKIPFLTPGTDLNDQEAQPKKNYSLLKYARSHSILLVFHLLFLAFNAVLLVSNTTCVRTRNHVISDNVSSARTFTPAESALRHITVEEDDYEQGPSPYTGDPSPELDQAWSRLLRSTLIRVTKEEMLKMNKTSVRLLDGSGYVGYLEAFHLLHCVRVIYQSHHPEYYPKQQREGDFTPAHLYHCLDVLREGIMCNPDLTLDTLSWVTPRMVEGSRPEPRKCADWDHLQAWADDRTLPMEDLEEFLATFVVPSNETGSIGPVDLLK